MTHSAVDYDLLLLQVITEGDHVAAAELIGSHASSLCDASAFDALEWAARNGHAECAKLLISGRDVKDYAHSVGIRWAANNGHADCVELLIPLSSPEGCHQALYKAAENGHAACVKLLASKCDARQDESLALCLAAVGGHDECVKALIPLSDPSADNFCALFWAARSGHSECVKLLVPVSAGVDQYFVHLRAAEGGHFSCVAVLWELIPSLSHKVDVFKFMSQAIADGNLDLADFFQSIIERRSIASSLVANANAPASARPPRL